jgi:hypothetical protein
MNLFRPTKIRHLAAASMVVMAAAAMSVVLPAAPASASPDGILASGEALESGQTVTSTSGAFKLVMRSNGNLVAYLDMPVYGESETVWSSGTGGNTGARAVMQRAGNLVVYSKSGTALWWTDFGGHPGAYAVMQNDGNVVLYTNAGGAAVATWSSRTGGTTTSMTNCTSWNNAFGSIHTCLDTTVWHNGAHAGVLSVSAVKGRCWVDGAAALVGRYCGASRQGSYTMSGGVNEDWLNQSITSQPPMATFPVYYCTYLRIDIQPNGVVLPPKVLVTGPSLSAGC